MTHHVPRRGSGAQHRRSSSSRRLSSSLGGLPLLWGSSPHPKRTSTGSALNIQEDMSVTSFSLSESEPLLPKLATHDEEDVTTVSFMKVLRLSSREWWMILLGVLGSMVDGAVYPVFAIIFGEALEVFSLPASQVVPNIHKWAGLFLVLGVVSGISVFVKVCCSGGGV